VEPNALGVDVVPTTTALILSLPDVLGFRLVSVKRVPVGNSRIEFGIGVGASGDTGRQGGYRQKP